MINNLNVQLTFLLTLAILGNLNYFYISPMSCPSPHLVAIIIAQCLIEKNVAFIAIIQVLLLYCHNSGIIISYLWVIISSCECWEKRLGGDQFCSKLNCIGRESDPGLPRTANLLLLAGENSTTEPPMLWYSFVRAIRVVKYMFINRIFLNH